MSLFGDITTLGSAMASFSYAEGVIGENIANVNTVGYSTEVPDFSSLPNLSGVTIANVGSTRNVYLYNQVLGQLAQLGFTNARLDGLQQLANLFPEINDPSATDGLSAAINNLAAAWTALAAAPNTAAAQSNVLANLENVSRVFNTVSQQLFGLQTNLDTQVTNSITQVNDLESQILTLNKEIVSDGGNQNVQTSTLIDQRQQAAQQLVTLTGGSVAYSDNGAMIVTFNGGTLVDGVNTYNLGVLNSAIEPGLTDIGYVSVPQSSDMANVTADFTSGTLGGLVYARDIDVEGAMESVDKMASGIILTTNQINETNTVGGQDSGGATGIDLFIGDKAADMSVNPTVQNNIDYIGSTFDPLDPLEAGRLATMQAAALTSFNMYSEVQSFNTVNGAGIELNPGNPIDPQATLASQAAKFYTPPLLAGGVLSIQAFGNNAVLIPWTANESLDQVIADINQNSGGAFYATLETINTPADQEQTIRIMSNAPLTIFDKTGNLGQALQLSSVLTSSTPINNQPLSNNVTNQVLETLTLANAANELALGTQPVTPAAGGTVEVDNNPNDIVTWNSNQTIDTILQNIANAATMIGTPMEWGYNQPGELPQTIELVNVGGPPLGTNILKPNDPLFSVNLQDLTGNLTQVLNLNANTSATKIFSQLTTTVAGSINAVLSEQQQAQNLVAATEALQNQGGAPVTTTTNGVTTTTPAVNNVNLDQQEAQAMQYEFAYDAAVRMQYVLEDMLNFLITGVGSSSTSSNAPLTT
jgi:flagellar hook-associated protein 1 FlgK